MTKKIKTKFVDLSFTFRHKWDEKDLIAKYISFRDWRIAIWFRRDKVVGQKNFDKPKEWKNHMINQYNIGIQLLVIKAWVSISKPGIMEIPIEDK